MISFQIRNMMETDLPGADELRRAAGWNQTIEDWRRWLRMAPGGCFVAVQDGSILGTVTTISYGPELAWIGMMLVHPERRRQGIGAALMRQALDHLHRIGVQCVRLDATPAGRPLYEKLGFVEEWNLRRWQRPATASPSPAVDHSLAVRALTGEDWSQIANLDRAAFGMPRIDLLRSLAEGAISALVVPAQAGLRGWGLLRPGIIADYLGPLADESASDCLALVSALLTSSKDRPVFWDIPDLNLSARRTAEQFGFSPVRELTRMRLGPAKCSSDPLRQFGIADPAVG